VDPSELSPRRLRENEELMESLNRRLEEVVEQIREEDDLDADAPIAFFCECSDLACRERVHLAPGRFQEIHRDSELFVLVPGHEILKVERVVDQEADFLIVRKLV
jgi:hypothetical protein